MDPRRVEETKYTKRPELLAGQLEIFALELAELLVRANAKSTELEGALGQLEEAYFNFAHAFALMVEGNDLDTRLHLDRTLDLASRIAARFELDGLKELRLGFLLHDVGKWSVPRDLLQKPGPLTGTEWEVMRTHPVAGAEMVRGVVPDRAVEIIRCHHERWDGNGYPLRVARDEIPIGARIFSVVDVFDALTSSRPYRLQMPFEQALEIIGRERGKAFDPAVVDVFLDLLREGLTDKDRGRPWVADPLRVLP